jgi:cyclic-di-GMP-binding protein
MPSFDIANKIELQNIDNVINIVQKEIVARFDFKGSNSSIELDKKNKTVQLISEDEMRIDSMIDMLRMRLIKQKLNPLCFDYNKDSYTSGMMQKKELALKEGIDKESAKKIMKIIKDSKLKVESQIMNDIVRVTAKKIDDLQQIMQLLRTSDLELPLQFINLK